MFFEKIEKSLKVFAIYGIIELKESKYLIVVNNANFVCSILNKNIFQIVNTSFIRICNKKLFFIIMFY